MVFNKLCHSSRNDVLLEDGTPVLLRGAGYRFLGATEISILRSPNGAWDGMWKILLASSYISRLVMSHGKAVLKEGERGVQQSQKQGQYPEFPFPVVARDSSAMKLMKAYQSMCEAPHGFGTCAQGSAIPCHRRPQREERESSLLGLAV